MSAITAKASRKMKKYAVLTREPRCFLGSFDLSWEQRKLGDIADIVGGGTPSTGNQSYWDGDIDWYAPAEIADQIYANSSQKKITGLGYENSSAKMLPPGTVLFTSRAGIGKTAILTRKGCTNQGFQSIVPHRGELDSYFIFSRTEELKRYGELVGAGSTFAEVSGKQMAVMELMMPPTMREQQTIGGFFQQLDHLITLHQRKCALLFSPFQSFISMMFTTSTFSWEQRKFSELVQIERGGSPRPIDDFITDAPNGLNWVKIGDAPTQGNYITKTAEKIRPEGLSKTREVHPGDLILSNSMSFGKPYIMGIDGCIHDGWLLIRNTYGVFDLTFLCHLLGTPQMLSQYRSLAAGSTVNNLNKELVENTVVTIPSITEQRVLGDYLEQLDNLITLHQRKCIFFTGRAGRLISTVNKKRITSSWEQRKFSELYEKVSRKNDLTYGKDDIISVANMYFKADSYITDESYLLTYNIFELGDIAFEGNKSKNYAHGRFVENTIGNGIVSHVFDVFKPIMKPYDLQFWKYAINNEQLMGGILLRSTKASTMMTNLVANDFLQETFLVPAYPEQQKIGAFFQELDRLITLHQRKPFLMKWRTSDANRNQTNRLVL